MSPPIRKHRAKSPERYGRLQEPLFCREAGSDATTLFWRTGEAAP
jgi:hypothetical protein